MEISLPQDLKELPKEEAPPQPKIISYAIQTGDTLSEIAKRFGIKLSTLLWTNNLSERTILKPGEEILVPSKDGLLHRVKRGETLNEIAQKYKAKIEDIIEFNEIENDLIFEGQELFIPGGIKPPPPKPKLPPRPRVSPPQGKNCRTFPYGYCTYYVAQKRCIPWRGHAKTWLNNAKAHGFNVCYGANCEPAPGAIMVMKGNPFFGHVAYIEEVIGNKIIISEMNIVGWGKVSRREILRGDPIIRGIIY